MTQQVEWVIVFSFVVVEGWFTLSRLDLQKMEDGRKEGKMEGKKEGNGRNKLVPDEGEKQMGKEKTQGKKSGVKAGKRK